MTDTRRSFCFFFLRSDSSHSLALFICIHTSLTRWRPPVDRAPFVNENCFYKSDTRWRLQICASLWHFDCCSLPCFSCCWQLCSGINETGGKERREARNEKMFCLWPAMRRMRDVAPNLCYMYKQLQCECESVCVCICVSNWITVVLSLYLLPTNSSCHFSHVEFFSCSSSYLFFA